MIKRLERGISGNYLNTVKYKGYTITLYTTLGEPVKICNELTEYGVFLNKKTYHADYSRKQSFQRRCIKLIEVDDLPWFICNKDVQIEFIGDIINKLKGLYYYNFNAMIIKNTIEIQSLDSEDLDFKCIENVHPLSKESVILKQMNELIEYIKEEIRNDSYI